MTDTPSSEKIAHHYTAMGDSVDLLNAGKPDDMEADEWTATKARNVEYLEVMVAKDYWTDENMTDVNKAIKENS